MSKRRSVGAPHERRYRTMRADDIRKRAVSGPSYIASTTEAMMKRLGGKQLFTVMVVAGAMTSLTIVATSYGSRPAKKVVDQAAVQKAAQVKRGEYLVTIGGCNDCHTPWIMNKELGHPVPDMSRALSGHPRS